MNILNFIQQNFRNDFLDFLMPLISDLTDNGIHWIVLGVILFAFKKYRIVSVRLAAAIVYATVFVTIIKDLVDRVRPCIAHPINNLVIACPEGASFPSGHTTLTFAGATIIYLINKKLGILAYLLSLLVAFSRLYLYAHYPTDVLFGMILGIICGILGYATVSFIYPRVKIKFIQDFIPNTKFK